MTPAAQHKDFASYLGRWRLPRHSVGATRPGFLRRLIDAIYESRQRQTDREVARILARSGRCITDASEREMTQRLLGH